MTRYKARKALAKALNPHYRQLRVIAKMMQDRIDYLDQAIDAIHDGRLWRPPLTEKERHKQDLLYDESIEVMKDLDAVLRLIDIIAAYTEQEGGTNP